MSTETAYVLQVVRDDLEKLGADIVGFIRFDGETSSLTEHQIKYPATRHMRLRPPAVGENLLVFAPSR